MARLKALDVEDVVDAEEVEAVAGVSVTIRMLVEAKISGPSG